MVIRSYYYKVSDRKEISLYTNKIPRRTLLDMPWRYDDLGKPVIDRHLLGFYQRQGYALPNIVPGVRL